MRSENGAQLDPFPLWAKLGTDDGTFRYHPLLCHALDTAVVAASLWGRGLTDRLRAALADGLGLSEELARRWVVFLAALHDIGKATPAFQFRLPTPRSELERAAAEHVRRAGFPSPELPPSAYPAHGEAASLALPPLLRARGVPVSVAFQLADAVAGHHGRFPDEARLRYAHVALGGSQWETARQRLFGELAQLLALPAEAPRRATFPALVLLAGLVTVADWIASTGDPYFPYAARLGARPPVQPSEYLECAERRAGDAIAALRWVAPPRLPASGFVTLFPTLGTPRPLQQRVEELAERLPPGEPTLVIIEAPTGEGKTEAAWLLADRWGVSGSARGVYVGMPTRATGDALFARVREILDHRYRTLGAESVVLQLLHGHAALSAEIERVRRGSALPVPQELWDDEGERDPNRAGATVAGDWFSHRKRGLLAPFGVGTVDQALLAALRVRHSFLRLFGLAGRVVIFDEVHAYDTYMLSLFERLLEWLAAMGSSVLLLSATLPSSRRAALVAAFQRGLGATDSATPALPSVSYPRLTIATRQAIQVEPIGASSLARRQVTLESLPLEPDADGFAALGRFLTSELAEGGCAAVICNTVRQAQACYQALREFFPSRADDGEPELDLFHARYPHQWRAEREVRVLRRFGKPGGVVALADGTQIPVSRPRRAVLVATQVIEQSLDLDFDLLVTVPAPVDLLVQRAGRLHRHQRPARPPRLARPRLVLLGPPLDEDGLPIFDHGTCAVYAEHVLLRTWYTLRDRPALALPGDTDALIAAVYDDHGEPPGPAPLRERWRQTAAELRETLDWERNEAAKRWVGPPWNQRLQELTAADLSEDALDVHPTFQALTRLGEPSLTIVPLVREADGRVALAPAPHLPVDLASCPDESEAVRLLQWSFEVSGARLIEPLRGSGRLEQPAAWQRSPLLSRVFVAWFEADGSLPFGSGRFLLLDRELGVVDRREDPDAEL